MATPDTDPFRRVLRGLLRPLVRALIARGVTAPAFYRLLKTVYVEVARDQFRIGDDPPTDSRITLLTGVHRRDVREILTGSDDEWDAARAKAATFATVLGQWLARPDYTDAAGRPRALPRSGADGADFESLVRDVNRDIRPRTVLDELLRQGLVDEGEDGLLRVAPAAIAGPGSDADKVVFFASNVGDHLAAAAENLLADEPPFYERAVFYNNLTDASLDQVEARARVLAQTLLEDVNRESAALQERDRDATDPVGRYRLGIYFYREAGSASDNADEGA